MTKRKDWCYDPVTHSCDGRCQGASECPLAKFYRGRQYNLDIKKPTREEMVNKFIKSDKEKEDYEKFFQLDRVKIRKIFLSHPLGNNVHFNRSLADELCKIFMKKYNNEESGEDIIFVSPLHSFLYFEEDDPKFRRILMEICYGMVDISDEVWVCGSSSGCISEVKYARKKDKDIYVIDDKLEPCHFDNPLMYLENMNGLYTYDLNSLLG